MVEKINILPVPTWNHLGVNAADIEINKAGAQAELLVSPLSAGAEKSKYADQKMTDLKNGKEIIMESGMGSEYDCYVMEHAERFFSLTAKSRVGEAAAFQTILTPEAPFLTGSFAVSAEEGAGITVLQAVCSADETKGQAAALTRIYAAKDSFVRLIAVQYLGKKSSGFQAVAIYAEEGARVEVIRAVLGGSTVACGIKAVLAGSGSEFGMNSIYFGDDKQSLDFNDVAVHKGENTVSGMATAGVLAGESSKILRGTIDFNRGAKHAKGCESEDVLLLGARVKNRTVPLILCGEESVEGRHAATAGRMPEKQIYYLKSRGLTDSRARKLLVEGRFAPVIDVIPDDELRAKLTAGIERRLDQNETDKM